MGNSKHFHWALISIMLSCAAGCGGHTDRTEGGAVQETDEPLPFAATDRAVPEIQRPDTLDFDTAEWMDLTRLDPTIVLDMRYATDHNFVGMVMYPCGRCFLRPQVARAVAGAHRELQKIGLGLKVFDCYRPLPVQRQLWEKIPDPDYVADPRKGSMHNRGAAVDLTLVDAGGNELDLGTPYDYFGPEAHQDHTDLPERILERRALLRTAMESHGLMPIRTEWWHYSYRSESFPLSEWQWPCPGKGPGNSEE